MDTSVSKWGNSLAVRIPRTVAIDAGLHLGSALKMEVDGDRLILTPVRVPRTTLDALLERVTDDNTHSAIETGAPIGNEAW